MIKTVRLAAAASVLTLFPATLSSASADTLKVVASFSIIADFAQNVGGDRIELTSLVGPNGDAHVYEAKPADAVAMARADVILVNGLQFEGFLQRLVEASGSKAPIVELTKGGEILKPSEGSHDHGESAGAADAESHDHAAAAPTDAAQGQAAGETAEADAHDDGQSDPHAWQSVHNAEVYVKNIADAFCTADGAGCDAYRANAQTYLAKLAALEGEIEATVASIPQDRRTIITSHDAFGYFEHEYGITFLAPETVSTEAEASASDVAALIEQIREDKASAIFVENISDPRLAEQIASETGLTVGGELFSDALSDANGPAPTYIDMMRHNLSVIKAAIAGS